jgi:AcrR family transcriptional regulator
VLEVADRLVAERGTGVSTEEIAREAGVGVGTVFRHFPTKEALLRAVFVRRYTRMAERARSLADAEDPGAAFFGFVTEVALRAHEKNALSAALQESGTSLASDAAASAVRAELQEALGTLLRRAQDAGAVRGDIGTLELQAVMVGAARAAAYAADRPGTRDRMLAITLDGLRARREP